MSNLLAIAENFMEYLRIFLVITMAIYLLTLLWRRRKLYLYSWNVPGPIALPFIGMTYRLINSDTFDMFKKVKIEIEKSSNITKLWIGPKLCYHIGKPEYIEKYLSSSHAIEKDSFYSIVTEVLGSGLISSSGKEWKFHRKILAPCMSPAILKTYVEIFVDKSMDFVNCLKLHAGKNDVDWAILATRFSLQIFGGTAMKVDMNVLNSFSPPSDDDLGMCLRHLIEMITYRITIVPYHLKFIWGLSTKKEKFEYYKKKFNEITKSVMQKRIKEFKSGNLEILDGAKLDFLDLLLKKSNFTDTEIIDEIKTMLAAATDTTGMAICSTLMMIGMHPHVQQKLFEEVTEILGHNRAVQLSDLPKLKYTEQVIKESLRLFSPVGILARQITADINLGEYVIPEGTTLVFIPSIIHRNPKLYSNPTKFDPDRFLPEEIDKRHQCAFIPFSYGPRNCIGQQFEIMLLKIVMATIVGELKIFTDYESIDDMEFSLGIVLSFKHGVKLNFELRNKNN